MKILIAYAFCTMGGVETAIKNRIRRIKRDVCEIDLLFRYDYGGTSLFQEMDCRVMIEHEQAKVQSLIRNGEYDLVIVIDTREILEALSDMDYTGRVALEVHTTYAEGLAYLSALKSDLISFILVPSEYQKNMIRRMYHLELPVYVLPNALDVGLFDYRPVGFRNGKRVLLWVGRLDAHKNWRLFLRLAGEIHRLSDEFVFCVVGGLKAEKSEMDAFCEAVYREKLHIALRWLPFVDYEKMANLYSWVGETGGAYIVTSRNESFGMTVLEAMGCKCPVVVNDVGALGELVVSGQTGLILPMEKMDIEACAKEILRFVQDEGSVRQCAQNAHRMSTTTYDSASIGQRFIVLIGGPAEDKEVENAG